MASRKPASGAFNHGNNRVSDRTGARREPRQNWTTARVCSSVGHASRAASAPKIPSGQSVSAAAAHAPALSLLADWSMDGARQSNKPDTEIRHVINSPRGWSPPIPNTQQLYNSPLHSGPCNVASLRGPHPHGVAQKKSEPSNFVLCNLQHMTNEASCARGRHNMPRPLQVDLWLFDLESGVRVTRDVANLCANFSLSRPLFSP